MVLYQSNLVPPDIPSTILGLADDDDGENGDDSDDDSDDDEHTPTLYTPICFRTDLRSQLRNDPT